MSVYWKYNLESTDIFFVFVKVNFCCMFLLHSFLSCSCHRAVKIKATSQDVIATAQWSLRIILSGNGHMRLAWEVFSWDYISERKTPAHKCCCFHHLFSELFPISGGSIHQVKRDQLYLDIEAIIWPTLLCPGMGGFFPGHPSLHTHLGEEAHRDRVELGLRGTQNMRV